MVELSFQVLDGAQWNIFSNPPHNSSGVFVAVMWKIAKKEISIFRLNNGFSLNLIYPTISISYFLSRSPFVSFFLADSLKMEKKEKRTLSGCLFSHCPHRILFSVLLFFLPFETFFLSPTSFFSFPRHHLSRREFIEKKGRKTLQLFQFFFNFCFISRKKELSTFFPQPTTSHKENESWVKISMEIVFQSLFVRWMSKMFSQCVLREAYFVQFKQKTQLRQLNVKFNHRNLIENATMEYLTQAIDVKYLLSPSQLSCFIFFQT